MGYHSLLPRRPGRRRRRCPGPLVRGALREPGPVCILDEHILAYGTVYPLADRATQAPLAVCMPWGPGEPGPGQRSRSRSLALCC